MLRFFHELLNFAFLVGDPHVKKMDIAEAKLLVTWIVATAVQWRIETGIEPIIVFMGDQSDDFAVFRAEVLEFWVWAYDYVSSFHLRTLSQVGNQRYEIQEETASTMSPFDVRTILAKREPVFLNPTTAAIGFIRNEELFHKTVMGAYAQGVRTILCHTEFEGSQYENGTYAPHGFDLSKYPADLYFITGHIHKKQQFGNVLCVGTPRPGTRSDIGEVKGIHIVSFKAVPESPVSYRHRPTYVNRSRRLRSTRRHITRPQSMRSRIPARFTST